MSDNSIPLRQCKDCKEWFPRTTDHFYFKSNHGKKIPSTRCKPCEIKSVQDRYWANPEPRKAQARKHYHDTRTSEAIQTNRDRASKWQIQHPERAKTRKHKHYLDNKDMYLAKGILWREENPDGVKVIYNRREARKRDLPDTFTVDDWRKAVAYFDNRCAVCGRTETEGLVLSMDHWIPLASLDCPGTIKTNIIPLCNGVDGCNNQKQDSDAKYWLTWKFGASQAQVILARVRLYFAHVQALEEEN